MGIKYPEQPQIAVGVLVFNNNKVLLVLRGHSPAKGMWSLPGGSIKLGEHSEKAAEREVFEETSIVVKAKESINTFDVIERDSSGVILYHYVIIDYIASFIRGYPCPNDDALEAGWFSAQELNKLSVVPETLKLLKHYHRFFTFSLD